MLLLALTRGQILRYILLPGILPRLRDIVGSGFSNLSYFMAQVYRAVNILPDNHPYLRHSNIGQYGIRDVLTEAANHLVFSTKNIDQIIIFIALLAGIVILIIQFFLLLVAILVSPAKAADMPTNYQDFFVTQAPLEDIAFRMMDMVFGVPGVFGSKEATETNFHTALHGLMQFYSIGLLVIAVLIVIYFIGAIVAETAQTGTPFGKRYNHVWAPIRLVAALGLLIPISYGLNSAQWITLYAAKFGSGFATNGWNLFNETLSTTYLGDGNTLIATPETPELLHLAEFMMIAQTCKIATEGRQGTGPGGGVIDAYLVKGIEDGTALVMPGDYESALNYFHNGDIFIRIGIMNDSLFSQYKGHVQPTCGDIVLYTSAAGEVGAKAIQEAYYKLLYELWTGNVQGMRDFAQTFYETYDPINETTPSGGLPGPGFKIGMATYLEEKIADGIEAGVEAEKETLQKDEEYRKYGWGGAGIWYNKIAQLNGALVAATMNLPQPQSYPFLMEKTREERMQQNNNPMDEISEMYSPNLSDGRLVRYTVPGDLDIAYILYQVHAYWVNSGGLRVDQFGSHTQLTGNAFIDAINAVLGTKGLFDMCRNADIHPLAQLSNVGKGLIESAIRNLGLSLLTGAGGIAVSMAPHAAGGIFGGALQAASGFFMTIAGIGILIGFILFYIVPFLPFLYFLFAVGGWIKGIFEAMVGVPLWALAHLRIDGQGLPGDAAMNGYFLIFEIFLRPILIIFGLLASVSIFGAMVKVLNEIFYLVVSNLSGFDPTEASVCGSSAGGSAPVGSLEWFRGPVDEFFFTVIYTIIVYMIGMSCFKLIDLIPNNLLRWMGAGVSTFNDQAGEPAEGLVQKMTAGGYIVSGQLKQAGSEFSSALKHGMKIPDDFKAPPPSGE